MYLVNLVYVIYWGLIIEDIFLLYFKMMLRYQ